MKRGLSILCVVLLLVSLCLSGCGATKLTGKFYSPRSMTVYYEFTSATAGYYVDEDTGTKESVTYKMVKLDEGSDVDYLVFITGADGKELTFMYYEEEGELYEPALGTFSKDYLLTP